MHRDASVVSTVRLILIAELRPGMTSAALFLKSGWIKSNAPLANGLGRFVPQLARLTIKFCKHDGSSSGVRQFIQQDVVQFAKQNPR